MRTYIKILLFAVLLSSCEEATELDLTQAPPRIVIEALLTNKPESQSVKVSRSTDFYGSGQTPRVDNATVTISDDTGLEFTFIHNPRNHPDSMGIYIPEKDFSGEIGKTYTLHVNVDGGLYEATD
ncbi:MAG: DUF4249 family protein, partial [Cyclobacteriaceae bacterium]